VAVHVHVGPTLPARQVRRLRSDAVVHPPVAHGDLLRAGYGRGDVVVVVDGLFHHAASVRHKEILLVLARGARVLGCSSMGALRAAELHPYGMVGHGAVFAMYRDGVVVADDEVAVAHGEPPDYRRTGEPLVVIRHAVASGVRAGVLRTEEADAIVATAAALHYPRRSWRAVTRGRPDLAGPLRSLADFLAGAPAAADVKAADAVDTLERLDELAGPPEPGRLRWVQEAGWHSRFLSAWRAEEAGTTVSGTWVGDAAVLRYQQIHHPGLPDLWRRFVLSRPGVRPDALRDAVHGSGGREWLTARERAELPTAELAELATVRSYRPPRPTWDLVRAHPDLVANPAARRAVAESYAVNAEVGTLTGAYGPDDLRLTTLSDHLAECWRVRREDREALTAAARDRGFPSVADAVEAARPFFLRHHVRTRARALPAPAGRPAGD
jgi:hypothetical protein